MKPKTADEIPLKAYREIYESGAMRRLTPEHQTLWASGGKNAPETPVLETNSCENADCANY